MFTAAYPPRDMCCGTTMVGVIDVSERMKTEAAALRASERRYENRLQAMGVSFREVEFTGVRNLLRDVRASGVTDFRKYFRDNPGILRDIMQATRVVDVTDQTLALFGRGI